MASDHILYLTSAGNLGVYPKNNPANFINRLPTPIVLETNTEYEVGLVSILYPDQYYGILANNDLYNINILTSQKNIGLSPLIVKIHQNILAGDLEKIVKIVNKNLVSHLKVYYGNKYKELFPSNNILKWNRDERKVEIYSTCKLYPKEDIQEIFFKINVGLAKILGINENVAYTLFSNKINKGSNKVYKSSKNPSPCCGVDYIYLYSDIIQPSNFGGQLVNILDCFSLQNGGNRGIHNSIYKPLNTHLLDQISIKVTDQNGKPVSFVEESTLTCVIHIRPK